MPTDQKPPRLPTEEIKRLLERQATCAPLDYIERGAEIWKAFASIAVEVLERREPEEPPPAPAGEWFEAFQRIPGRPAVDGLHLLHLRLGDESMVSKCGLVFVFDQPADDQPADDRQVTILCCPRCLAARE